MQKHIKRYFIGYLFQDKTFRSYIKNLQQNFAPLRPCKPENIHLTYAFLGQEAEPFIPKIIDILKAIDLPNFKFDIQGLKYFTNQKSEVHTIYLPLTQPSYLLDWQQNLSSKIWAINGYKTPPTWQRRYTPHISIIRPKPHIPITEAEALIASFKELKIEQLHCKGFGLYYKNESGFFTTLYERYI